ncbi:hypothetical protein MHU86_21585 [Fragilaria crotonensis]|nr:hypothetical protein MHU86_21585 [Fragilaria crotonensis]
MAREISDAVDFNLQKWKTCLKELQDMEKDGIAVNHPVFLASKATAKLREASFNASLATATEPQATIKLVDTPINAVYFPNTMSAVGASRNDIESYSSDNEQQLCTKTTSCGSSCSSSST